MNNEEQKIVALSRKIVDIELRKDADELAPYITDDYIGVDPSGLLIDKETSVGRYRRDDFCLYEHGISDVTVSIFGDAAIEIGVMTLKGHLGKFEFGGRYRYTHIWIETGTGWKIRASQLTPILRE